MCAVVLAVSVASCGGREDSDADAGSTTTSAVDSGSTAPQDTAPPQPGPPDTEAPVAPQDRTADQALAESIVLRPGDAPADWTSEPPDGSDDSEYDRRYAECVGIPIDDIDPDFPEAEGYDLTSPEDSEVTSSATVAPSADAARLLMNAYRDADTPECFADVLEDVLVDTLAEDGAPSDVTVGRPTFEPLPYAALGDETEAFRVTMTVSGNARTIELYADVVLVRSGRVAMEALFMSLFEPFPVADSEGLMRVMVNRVPAGA
jgi:hypothetical protein